MNMPPQSRSGEEKQTWAEAVVECVSDSAERERLIRLYDYDELVHACLALGTLALTAKHEAARNKELETQLVAARSEKQTYLPPADANGKRPRLFYWEDAEDCWCPAEGLEVDNIISVDLLLGDGDTMEIRFKREDMTDAEFDAIPEG